MSAADETQPAWLEELFWERLDRIELHHQRIQCEHETRRRSLDRFRDTRHPGLRLAWQRYCEVIAELERTSAQLEALRISPHGPFPSAGEHEAPVASRLRRA